MTTVTKYMLSRRRMLALGAATIPALAALRPEVSDAQSQPRFGIGGQDAPELDINYWIDGDGKPANFSVKASAGKWVFLKCFQNWCPGCHSSGFPTLKAFADEFHGHPSVAIAGIQTVFEGFSNNTQDDVRKLQLRYELPIVMGHDAGNPNADNLDHRPGTMVNYRTGGTPWLILIDPTGKVVFNDYRVNRSKLIEFIHEQIA